MKYFDVIIIGSGLGGLTSALILAKEGKKVLVLEKNNQFGGCLQTFARDKTILDTGVHYIGGLAKGQNLNTLFQYLGILEDLPLKQLDQEKFDLISFENDPVEYPHAQGSKRFIEELSKYFPSYTSQIQAYIQKVEETCAAFPLYHLDSNTGYDLNVLQKSIREVMEETVSHEKLREVLLGSNFLYAGNFNDTPFYVHALSVNSYIQSAWRVIRGGSQITRLLIRQLKAHGGEVKKHQEVSELLVQDQKIYGVKTTTGEEFFSEIVISNVDLKKTLQLSPHFKKSFKQRVDKWNPGMGAFSMYLIFKPGTFPYKNYNFYHHLLPVTEGLEYTEENWPPCYMASMGLSKETEEFAESMSCMTYMRYSEVEKWKNTFHTVHSGGERGTEYEEFKKEKAERFLSVIERKFPGIRECIHSVYTSTPLSYRDYIGGEKGNMYGYEKSSSDPMLTMVSPKSKIEGLYFTGQTVNMHGILGVSLGAISTCAEILDRKELLNKIRNEA